MHILGFIKPSSPKALYCFNYTVDTGNINSYSKLLDNVNEKDFIFTRPYMRLNGGIKYFIYKNDLYSIKNSETSVTKIDEGGWTHITGEGNCNLGNGSGSDLWSIALGIKNNKLYKITEENISEIGSEISSNNFINVTGITSEQTDNFDGLIYCAYALTDKNEIITINKGLLMNNISIFDESNVINSFFGTRYQFNSSIYYPHILVDNKIYRLSENEITLVDDSKKYIKLFGEYCGPQVYQYVLDDSNTLYAINSDGIIKNIEIRNGDPSDLNKWEYVNNERPIRYAVYGISNNKLYYFYPTTPDAIYDDESVYSAYLVDDTTYFNILTNKMSWESSGILGVSNNKLYTLNVETSLPNDEFVHNLKKSEVILPDTYTKCLDVHLYASDNANDAKSFAIFQ